MAFENLLDYTAAWPSCEAFESTTEFIEVYEMLQRLFKLHASLLLHKALAVLHEKGALKKLSHRPFVFFIAEHNCEVNILYQPGPL